MWVYKTGIPEIGDIRILKRLPGLYFAVINTITWQSSDDPDILAYKIYKHDIGCPEWDSLAGKVPPVPADLEDWDEEKS